jgi:predicted Zn-dependent protease
VSKAGDYFMNIEEGSARLLWTGFPVKVFAVDPPKNWGRATHAAVESWAKVFPLALVAAGEQANIIISWASLPKGTRRMGSEKDLFTLEKVGDSIAKRTKQSFITLDSSRRWSDDEMRAALMHEIGHALGIQGHSDGRQDVMFPEEEEIFVEAKGGEAPDGVHRGPSGMSSSLLANKKLTKRDVNTLIRLYNCAGPALPLR